MVLKLEGKRPLGRSSHRCADNIKLKLLDVGCVWYEVGSRWLRIRKFEGQF
jgi:hypothetical protein